MQIGFDPEFFLLDNKSVVPASSVFSGSKEKPSRLVRSTGFVQVDGVAVEFNTPPLETEWNDFIDVGEMVLSNIIDELKEMAGGLTCSFLPAISLGKLSKFSKADLQVGCSPDFNEYGQMNPIPSLEKLPVRTAGGHIHLGHHRLCNLSMDDAARYSKHFTENINKRYFGYIEADPYTEEEQEASKRRLQYYGGASAFRPKQYGLELRAFDNLWLTSSIRRKAMLLSIKEVVDVF